LVSVPIDTFEKLPTIVLPALTRVPAVNPPPVTDSDEPLLTVVVCATMSVLPAGRLRLAPKNPPAPMVRPALVIANVPPLKLNVPPLFTKVPVAEAGVAIELQDRGGVDGGGSVEGEGLAGDEVDIRAEQSTTAD